LQDWSEIEAEQGELYQRLEGDWRRSRERDEPSLWHGYELTLVGAWLEDIERTRRWALRYSAVGEAAVEASLKLLQDSVRAEKEAEAARKDEEARNLKQQLLMERVTQSERLAAVGRLAAGVAHQIINPMAVIAEISGYLLDVVEAGPKEKQRLLDKEMLEGLPKIEAQVRRCRSITSRLLRFAHKSEVRTEVADVRESLDEILHYLEKQARLAGVQIHRRLNTELPKLSIEDLQFEEVFIALIKNAIHAMSPRGHGNIWLFGVEKDGKVILTVRDDGPGIAEEVKDRLFDPFVSTNPEATGLGLSICYGIVKRHGGEILVQSQPGKGTTFQIILPVYYQAKMASKIRPRRGNEE
jgi:signal transduction histidine kinase